MSSKCCGMEAIVREEEAWLGITPNSAMMKKVHHVFLAVNPAVS